MAEILEEYVNAEKNQADLLHQIVNPNSLAEITGSGYQDEDYLDSNRLEVTEFSHLKNTPLPKEIHDEIKHMQSNCNFGIIPLLSRAWVTVDSNLFLWNFKANKDLAYYDAINTTIQKVELVRVKPNFFEDTVKFLLVIVTVEEIVLLAVSFVSERDGLVNITKGFDDPNIFLIMQEIHKSPLDGLIVNQLHCTQNGRIFFGSEDALYELAYYFGMWNNRVYKRVNLTKGFFSGLVSAFGSKDNIRQIECDNSRHILYTLSTQSKISVYDLGERGNDFSYVTSYSVYALQREIGNRFSIDYELLKEITAITAVPSTQSMYVNLFATLSSGCRVYFTCSNEIFFEKGNERFSQSTIRPVNLKPIHFRCSPMPVVNFLNSTFTSYYTRTIDDITVIVLGSPNSNIPSTFALSTSNFPHSNRLRETRESLLIEQLVWSIESASTQHFEREFIQQEQGKSEELELVPATQPNAFSRQHIDRQTTFYVITAQGIDTFVHKKPVELLHNLLERFGPESRQIKTFFTMHGPLEICVMSLILMSSDTQYDGKIKEMALRLFTTHGGQPINRSRAIFTYFTRIVYSIWRKRVCSIKNDLYVSGLSLEEVREVLRYVSGLRRVVEGYALFTGAHHGEKDLIQADESLRQEKISVKALHDLMILSQEYLALWQIILENNFHSTILNLNSELQAQFQNLTFGQLVGLPESVGLELISALVHYYLGDETEIAAINERLGNECPRLFTNDDANVFKATELIFFAKKAQSIKERQDLVDRALTILKRHAKRVNLYEVSMLLRQINYFKGIADLTIACANAVDPRGLALLAYRRRTPETETPETLQAIKKREDIYAILVDTLSYLQRLSVADGVNVPQVKDATLSPAGAEIERDLMIDFIVESNDDLCHVALFRFLIDNQLENLLIRKKNPQFERFIAREIKETGDPHFMELLWRYYNGVGDFAKAALLLYELATKTSRVNSVDKKMEYLSQAALCANSSPETPQNVELRQKIRDWLDVALIQQQVRENLRSAPANTFESTTLSENLKILDQNLLTLGDLLQIANKFELGEIKLKIYECAGIKDGKRV